MWNAVDEFRRAADDYANAHDGRDALVDALPWANALTAWFDSYLITAPLPEHAQDQTQAMRDPATRARIELVIAHQIRITMYQVRRPVGDIDLDVIGLHTQGWTQRPTEYTDPPTFHPPPDGPLGDDLRAVLALYDSEVHDQQWRILPQLARRIRRAHQRDGPSGQQLRVPLDAHIQQVRNLPPPEVISLAQRAWAIGMSPVPVRDPSRYADYDITLLEDHFTHVVS